jgi:hypothetical protein
VCQGSQRLEVGLDATIDTGGLKDADQYGKLPGAFDFLKIDHLIVADLTDDYARQLHGNGHHLHLDEHYRSTIHGKQIELLKTPAAVNPGKAQGLINGVHYS